MPSTTPLDDVEFLARSPHRVEVLRRLQSGSWTRPDLHAETGISQPTIVRVSLDAAANQQAARMSRSIAEFYRALSPVGLTTVVPRVTPACSGSA